MAQNYDLPGPSQPKRLREGSFRPLMEAELEKVMQFLDDQKEMQFLDEYDDFSHSSSSDNEDLEVDSTPNKTLPSSGPVDLQWENDSNSMKKFPFLKTEALLEIVQDEVVLQTNTYAVELFLRESTKEQSRITQWKDVTRDEFLIFLGLLLHMGNIRLDRLQDYWKTDFLFNFGIFSYNMSRNRFLLILKSLHFVQEETSSNRLDQIRTVVNFFNNRMSAIFYPQRELSLDEPMILWRGRLNFRQNKNKGLKLYMITDSSGMILRLMLDDFDSHLEEVVSNLLHGLLDVGHSVYMDNYYTSYELACHLLARKTYSTGILRTNRKTIPTDVKNAKLKKGETIAKYVNGVLVGKWKTKRDIITYISTQHENTMIKIETKLGQKVKPLPVINYNKYMSSMDRRDQILSYDLFGPKTIKWPSKIFIHILQLIMVNAYNLYNKYSGSKVTSYDFRISVIKGLLKTKPTIVSCKMETDEHVLKIREETRGKKVMRKSCKQCTSNGKRKDTIYVCTVCQGAPGYCLECAHITHKC